MLCSSGFSVTRTADHPRTAATEEHREEATEEHRETEQEKLVLCSSVFFCGRLSGAFSVGIDGGACGAAAPQDSRARTADHPRTAATEEHGEKATEEHRETQQEKLILCSSVFFCGR
jgi:hypothetical protein